MAEVTASLVKELRERTGAGMIECKKALSETGANIEKAIELLREKGLSAAAKKAGRIAAEGLTSAAIVGDVGVIVEVNSETDFVAKNNEFVTYVADVAAHVAQSPTNNIDELMAEKWIKDQNITVEEGLSQKIAVIGEKLTIRRFDRFAPSSDSALVTYIHSGGKVSVLLELETNTNNQTIQEAGKNIAMQIAAMSPRFVHQDEVSDDFKEKEREILKQQALAEGKPLEIVEKMIVGRLNKTLKEMCLIEQEYVKDGDHTIKTYLEAVSKEVGNTVTVKRFVRFETGEGIEKKEENFADEVNKAVQG